MSAIRGKIFQLIDSRRDEMLWLWEKLVNMESGSPYKEDFVDVLRSAARTGRLALDAPSLTEAASPCALFTGHVLRRH